MRAWPWPYKVFSVLVLCVLCQWVYWSFDFFTRPLTPKRATTLLVSPHQHLHDVAKALVAAGLLHHPRLFVFWGRLLGDANVLRFGKYRITQDMTSATLLSHIVNSQDTVKHPFRIGAGWTIASVLKRLEKDPAVLHTLSQGIGLSDLEGALYPDTFDFAWGTEDRDILQYAHHKMQVFLAHAWHHRAKGLPYRRPYEALIMASLIETETARAADRPKIAAVLIHRLRRHMPLAVDPTVLYGLKLPYGHALTHQELEEKTPYNTYHRLGLPPTPIAMPSKASILAALHPAKTHALYYVADGHGGHVFSDTYAAHQIAVRRYWRLYSRF